MKSEPDHDLEDSTTAGGLPVAPSLAETLRAEQVSPQAAPVDLRVAWLCLCTTFLGVVSAVVAWALIHLIAFVTHLSFDGRLSFALEAVPGPQRWGAWIIAIPVIGGLIVGVMARYGSKAIRGHGIPEAMEQVLLNQSRIPARITWLKPLSSAIAIGTGGPFGAEGPIIATGGALGSLLGQILHINANERKTLLAAGAAAGMAATFGAPVSATLLAVELLLFEFRPRSLIPVAFAAVTAAAIRASMQGVEPIFAMPDLVQPGGGAMAAYIVIGAIMGVVAMLVTRSVYFIEDAFEHLPIHWMWWPAIGGLVVGIVGYIQPRTLGVGYFNITDVLSNHLSIGLIISVCAWKFISWSISLGSGTSGGTLAPLFTIGAALGALLGMLGNHLAPELGIDLRVAALVGMAAIFAGASRALLASAVFAFETTLQPLGLLPLLGACSMSFLIASLLMRNSIMTEKIARRGVRVPSEYHADELDRIHVRDVSIRAVTTLYSDQTVGEVRAWIDSNQPHTSHQGYPIIDRADGRLRGVLTRRDLLMRSVDESKSIGSLIRQPPFTVLDSNTLREAVDLMSTMDIGRLPVVASVENTTVIGILTRGDVMRAYGQQIRSSTAVTRSFRN